ncbi:MAG: O-antigen ligase family protein [Phycisphaeraceae bacterium]|nr:O-antigen ligase family protein [Phycisphaeraceae bacterium]
MERNRRDGRGYRTHGALAVLGLVGLLAYDGAAEFLVWFPVAACLVRAIPACREVVVAALSPVGLAAMGVAAWSAVSLVWSLDPRQGFDEWAAVRHALLIPALWVVRDHRAWLIAALAMGFALGHVTQVGHAIGVWGDVAWLRWPRLPDRNSGWWDPVVGGSLATAAVGLHMAALLRGRGRWRVVGGAGVLAAMAGVVATGTRGAWLAAAGLVGLGMLVAVVGAVRRGGWRRVWVPVVIAAVGAGVGAVVAGPTVLERGERAVGEVRRVLEEGDFATDTGRRLLMWQESWRAVSAQPIRGVGEGGLVAWATRDVEARGIDAGLLLPHAHGMWAQVLAATGVVGGVLWAVVIVLALRVGWGGANESGDASRGGFEAAYATAPAWGLVGLLMAGVFDPVQLNSQTSMLLWAFVALCAMGAGSRRAAA